MLPLTAGVLEQEPDPTDLLIRAMSTLIWLLWPKVMEAKSHSKRHLKRLSRLSLLFVPAIQAADVAAITAVVGQSCVYVEAVQGSEETLNGRLNVGKNHIQSTPWNPNMLPGPEELKTELIKDPLLFCFTRGIAAITPDAHGAALQNLLTDMYKVNPTSPGEDSSRDPLRRYIYCFCHKKILQRLQSPIRGYTGRFVELFVGSKSREPITKEVFKRRTKRELSRCDNVDEHWLYNHLAKRHPAENFGPKPSDHQPYRLDLKEDQLWMLWELFTGALVDLNTALVWLDQHTRGTEADSYEKAVTILDTVAKLLKTLYHFIYSSPTFWSLVVEMENALIDRAGQKVAEDSRPLWSSPSSTDDPPTFPPSHQEGVAPSRPASQESAHGDADVSGGLDQGGLAHESDPGSSAYSDGEDSDDGLESEEVTGSLKLSGIALKVRTWLRRLTQWFGAVFNLSKGGLALGVVNRELKIHVDVAPKAVRPERQASLRAVADALEGRGTSDERLGLILTRARDVYGDRRLSENTATYALVKASTQNEASLEAWETLFPSSSVHCEAHLACIMLEKQIQNVAIGVSKQCCYCCGRLLTKLGFQKNNLFDHGKVYSWAPPHGLDHDMKQYILRKLKGRLEHYLEEYADRRRKADSSSGSDAWSCVNGKDDETYPRLDLGVDD